MTNLQTVQLATPVSHPNSFGDHKISSSSEGLSYDDDNSPYSYQCHKSPETLSRFPRLENPSSSSSDINLSYMSDSREKDEMNIKKKKQQYQHQKPKQDDPQQQQKDSCIVLTDNDDVEDDIFFSLGSSTDFSTSDDDDEGAEDATSKSSMTFGSAHHPNDSFAGVSNTGLSSIDSSLDDSRYYFRATFPARKQRERDNNTNDDNNGHHLDKHNANANSNANPTSQGLGTGKNDVSTRKTTTTTTTTMTARDFSRLTVQTHPETIDLSKGVSMEQKQHPSVKKGRNMIDVSSPTSFSAPSKTPLSQGTAGTDPITPMSAIMDDDDDDEKEKEDEFPSPQNIDDWNKTVQFSISKSHSRTSNSGIPRTVNPSQDSANFTSNTSRSKSMSMSISMMSRDDLPSFDTSYLRQRRMTKEHRARARALAERDFFNHRLREQVVKYGPESEEAAKAMVNLGSSLLRCKAFSDALSVYKRAVPLLRAHFGDESLIVARGLDKIGVAASKSPTEENLDWALLALKEALSIRISFFGPNHCDCVETLNNIAGVYLHKREWEVAKDLYLDVLTTRSAIFGRNHGSIAVAAETLGKVFTRVSDLHNALRHYELALEIYRGESMNLGSDHPLVVKVTKSITSTEHLMSSLRYSR